MSCCHCFTCRHISNNSKESTRRTHTSSRCNCFASCTRSEHTQSSCTCISWRRWFRRRCACCCSSLRDRDDLEDRNIRRVSRPPTDSEQVSRINRKTLNPPQPPIEEVASTPLLSGTQSVRPTQQENIVHQSRQRLISAQAQYQSRASAPVEEVPERQEEVPVVSPLPIALEDQGLYVPKKRSVKRNSGTANMSVSSPSRFVNGNKSFRMSSSTYSSARGGAELDGTSSGGVTSSRRISMRHSQNLSGSAAQMAETVSILRRRCAAELGAAMSKNIVSSYDRLMEWISAARLRRLPTEGSSWDKVLAWAQAFAEKFNEFDIAIEQFTGSNFDGAELAFGYCVLLLELGEENAAALQTSFGFFFKCSLDLIALLDRVELFNASSTITDQLVLSYGDLVTLVSDISLRFYQVIKDTTGTNATSIDIYNAFGSTIDSFQTRRETIVDSMWRHQMSQENVDVDRLVSISILREWLAVHDQILKLKSGDHTTLVNDRQQLTCLWLQPYLTRFLNSSKSSLSIVGPPGSGKSVLAGTIVDTLQRVSARRSHSILFVPISAKVQSQTSSAYLVRSLLSQLFEARVGNVKLYKILADAYDVASKCTDLKTYESTLWTALGRAIEASLPAGKDVIIVVDGLDELSGPADSAQVAYKHLVDAVSKSDKVRLITLSDKQALGSKPGSDVIEVDSDLLYDDIFSVVSSLIAKHPLLEQVSTINQDILVSHIVTAANGSFLYAKLITKKLLLEPSLDKFTKSAEGFARSPKPIHEIIKEYLTSPELTDEGKQLLVWLSISQRPLSISELSTLYSIDTRQATKTDKHVDVLRALRPVTSLVFLQDGLFNIRHAVIRHAIITHFEQQKPQRKPSLDLSLRLLTYLKTTIREQPEPTFKPLTRPQVDRVFNQDPLAEYAVRYWTTHFSETPFSTVESTKDVYTELTTALPTSPVVPLLEQYCWLWQPSPVQLTWHKTTTDVRRKVFKDNHPSVLQAIILLAMTYRHLDSLEPALLTYYQAWQISVNVFSRTHPITTQCANTYLEITRSITITSRTEVISRREEILVYLIEVFKAQYGATSEQAISLQTQLYELYKSLKEDQKAAEIHKVIYGTSQDNIADTTTSRGTTGLGVRVTRRGVSGVTDYQDWDVEEERDVVLQLEGSKRVSELLELAKTYAAKGQTARAEQTYFEAWSIVTMQSRNARTIETETEKIDIALTIAQFFKSTKRESEASALLTGVWKEYQSSSVARSERVTSKLVEVGKFLQTVSLSAVALNIFRYCAEYMKSTSKQESSMYREVQERLEQSHKEVMKQASSSSASASQMSESIMTEIITSMQSSKSTSLDITSVSAVKQIVAAYIAQARYKEATTTVKKSLFIIWPTLFSPSPEDVGQPIANHEFAFEMVERLISIYQARHRTAKTQDYRERLYRALKAVRKIDDTLVQHNIRELFRIYEWNKDNDKIIQLHQELLEDYRKNYGPAHPEVIKALFVLARLTSPSPISTEYYRQIVVTLTKDSDTCHPDALEALSIVAETYWNERRPQDTTWAYSLLFRTFTIKGKEIKSFQSPEFVLRIYNRLISSLRSTFVDITVIHQRTTEYRQACIKTFSATHKTSIEATLILARLCSSTRRYQSEAISLYQILLKESAASEYHKEISISLDAIYEEQALEAARSTSTSISSEQADRAVSVIRQRISKSRSEFGWAHEESLERMQEVTSLYAKQQNYQAVNKELTESTKQIISNESSSASMIRGASSVASAFIATNQTTRGIEMAEELRWQLITKDSSNAKKYEIDVTQASRASAIYIAQLEYSLRKDTSTTFAEIYISILTEIVYYEEFQQYIRTGQSIENVLSVAARFYSFLALHQRLVMLRHVEDELVSYFIRTSGEKAKVGDAAQVKILVLTMLEYLQTHKTTNFVRSVSIASLDRVRMLVNAGQHKPACDLGQTASRYVHAHGGYSRPAGIKQGLALAFAIADLEKINKVTDKTLRQSIMQVAGNILRQTLTTAKTMNLNWAALPVGQLNSIITILGEEKDYVTLEWILTLLWEARDVQQQSFKAATAFALGRRLIVVRYLIGKHDAALHLATDIAYNLRRVYGASNLATLDVNVLLSQVLVSTGLSFLSQKGGEHIAKRYFKRAVDVHENVLRSLTIGPLDLNDEDDTTVLSVEAEPLDVSMIVDKNATQGTYARKHMHMLKLALERFGGFPKGYPEYENLNADVFRAYPEEMRGAEGVEKWNVKGYGNGKASSEEGALNTHVGTWALELPSVQHTSGLATGTTTVAYA